MSSPVARRCVDDVAFIKRLFAPDATIVIYTGYVKCQRGEAYCEMSLEARSRRSSQAADFCIFESRFPSSLAFFLLAVVEVKGATSAMSRGTRSHRSLPAPATRCEKYYPLRSCVKKARSRFVKGNRIRFNNECRV